MGKVDDLDALLSAGRAVLRVGKAIPEIKERLRSAAGEALRTAITEGADPVASAKPIAQHVAFTALGPQAEELSEILRGVDVLRRASAALEDEQDEQDDADDEEDDSDEDDDEG